MSLIKLDKGFQLLFLAIVLAATALASVSFFADRVERGLTTEGAAALAADLVLESSRPIAQQWRQAAQQRGLATARTVTFPTVLLINDKPQLVQLKAVDEQYPLRGALIVAQYSKLQSTPPLQGHAVAARQIFDIAGQASFTISFGKQQLLVDGLLQQEPDPGLQLFQLAPRFMVNLQDIEASQLLGPASRAHYRLLVAGKTSDVKNFHRWIQSRDHTAIKLITLDDGRPEITSAMDRARRFLGLAALSASLLAGIGIMLATRHLIATSTDAVAILRTLGMTSWQVLIHYLYKLLLVTLIASLLGAGLGFLLQTLLTTLAGNYLDMTLPAPGWEPLLMVITHALILVSGFALPVISSLLHVSPLRVLRRDLAPTGLPQWLISGIGALAFYLLIHWQAKDVQLANQVALGITLLITLYAAAAYLLLQLLRLWRTKNMALTMGMASLARNPGITTIQLTGYALSITVLLLLTLVRGEITTAWQNSLPDDAPNYFLVNIQPAEVQPLQNLLDTHGIRQSTFYPTTRGRLSTVNGTPLNIDSLPSSRAKRLANREFSLGFSTQLQTDNHIIDGQWPTADTPAFSIEKGLAKTLNLKLGDTLEFNIAGQSVSAPVTSIREVSWDSFNVNFFIQGTPALLKDLPYAVITSLYVPESKSRILTDIAQQYPAISSIHLAPLLNLVRNIIKHSSWAIEGLFLFTLIAAMLVTLAAVQINREQRQQEVAVMRTLGASNRQVLASVLSEYFILGLIASVLAATAAHFAGVSIADRLFGLSTGFSPVLWGIGVSGGLSGILVVGYFVVRPILRTPPMRVLR